ncbi:MAG: hypothetical protein CK532_05380 [Flavobacteriales bacterium]|nr:MAG: hypothetical protein CK532_05380 [Flavobacteriales bacterium]
MIKNRASELRSTVFLMGLCFCIISCSNNTSENKAPEIDLANLGLPGTETPDGIAPIHYTDTVGKDLYGKDSVKMSVLFQLAANDLGKSYLNKNAETYSKYTLPAIVKANGGLPSYIQKLQLKFSSEQESIVKILSGPIHRIQPLLDEKGFGNGWYCLMPVKIFRKESTEIKQEMGWMGGQTLDEGKTIYFIDISNMPKEKIMQIMPDLRCVLVK